MSPKSETTNLWSLAWRLQEQLEDQGLDDDVVDAAVTRGLAEIVAGRQAVASKPRLALRLGRIRALAKA